MAIPILAVAFGIYIFGISLVLYLRPHIMFGKGGDWKEFGIGRGENRTVIPFWLFAIFWAFISYGVALVIMSQFATIANGAFPEQNIVPVSSIQQPTISMQPQPQYQMPSQQPQFQMPSQQPQFQMPSQPQVQAPYSNDFLKPVSSALGISNNQPGYYVLQSSTPGLTPQYVYYGTEPPRLG